MSAMGAGAAPEATVGTDVDDATGDVLGVEVEVAAAETGVWTGVETEAGPVAGSVPVDTGAGQMVGAEMGPAAIVAVEGD